MYINTINAIILGYLLVITAGALNYAAENTLGFFFAIVSVAATYFAENLREHRLPGAAAGCMLISGTACVLSYLVWFLG